MAGDPGLRFRYQGYCKRGGGGAILTRIAIRGSLAIPTEEAVHHMVYTSLQLERCNRVLGRFYWQNASGDKGVQTVHQLALIEGGSSER